MFEELLRSNQKYAESFCLAGIPARAARGFALVTCMDSRIEPLAMLGLVAGDAKIMRNAGGRVTDDVLRSLILATRFLGVEEIAVMQHTKCALAHRSDEEIWRDLPSEAAGRSGMRFLAMPDPDASLAADVEAVRACELLPQGIRVEGWRYDVATGIVERLITA